jgi:hypothetical protein
MSQPTELNSQDKIYLTLHIHTYMHAYIHTYIHMLYVYRKLKKIGVAMATLGLKVDPSLPKAAPLINKTSPFGSKIISLITLPLAFFP